MTRQDKIDTTQDHTRQNKTTPYHLNNNSRARQCNIIQDKAIQYNDTTRPYKLRQNKTSQGNARQEYTSQDKPSPKQTKTTP